MEPLALTPSPQSDELQLQTNTRPNKLKLTETAYYILLTGIKGMSRHLASAVMKEYPTIQDFMKAAEEKGCDFLLNCDSFRETRSRKIYNTLFTTD